MSQEPRESFQIIRKLLPYTTVATLLALLYIGWVFYGRFSENRALQRAADQKGIAEAKKNYELYGSGQLKILLFYAAPPSIARGGKSELCFGVSNATSMKIEPGVEELKPSLNRCVPIQPTRTTTYTLTASDDKGHTATQSVNVVIR